MSVPEVLSSMNADIIIRVFASIALGFLIGIERELTNKSAGLRTHILVCLGSTIFTILSIYGFNDGSEGARITHDPARIAAQILTGIGFIGGGAVLHHGVSVYGLTTAASLWITASIGMAVGAGAYPVAILAALLALVVLVAIRQLERGLLARHTRKGARIKASIVCTANQVPGIQDWFYKTFENIIEMHVEKSTKEVELMNIVFILDVFDSDPISKAYKNIRELKNIESLTLQRILDEDSLIC